MIRRSVQSLQAYIPGEQPTDPRVVKLNTNENPYPPSPAVAQALGALDPESLRKYPPPACTRLRGQIASIHGCDPRQVFVGNGSDEVLALCTRAFVNDGEAIGYHDPSYSLYPVLAAIRDVPTAAVALGEDFGWAMPERVDASLFFLTNPNAPTGIQHPADTVAAFCRAFPGVVVVDEAYVDFAGYNCLDLALELPNVLVVRTLSKSFSLAGLRLGYAIGSEPLVGALMKVKDSYNVGFIQQRLAEAALSDLGHMRANVARIVATRERLSAALSDRGFHVHPSATNFVWARPVAMPARDLFERLRDRGIVIRHFHGPRTGDHVRITVGTDAEIDRFLEVVDELSDERQA